MVVLDGGGMLSTSGNQYLQPDYLSPLPTTLDAKNSPLALLAQTCSQIGADSPSTKPLISPLEKSKKNSDTTTRSSPAAVKEKSEKPPPPRHTPTENNNKLVFKPYENNVVSKKSDEIRPNSKPNEEKNERKSVSPASSGTPLSSDHQKTPTPVSEQKSPSTSASPIIRSGLEIMHSKDNSPVGGSYKSPISAGLNPASAGPLSSMCCPPGLEHPAFRPPFPGGYSPHHHAAAAAAMLAGYPGTTNPGPFLSYARVKTASGGEALVPVCKDPYCTGCQFSMHNQQLLMSGSASCPSGCTQCDHQKYNLAMAMSLVPPPPPPTGPSLGYPPLGRPLICNWISGDTYCGKRFMTSEELLQHLRTHTSGSVIDSGSVVTSAASSLLNPHSLFSSAALSRPGGYPNPPLSPLSAAAAAARYHPYGKPTLPSSLAASPYSAFNPTALGPYYSAYSVYGQRLGAAAVHP